MSRLRLLVLPVVVAAFAAFAALTPAAAPAQTTNVTVAIADQSTGMFFHPAWQALRLKRTRYFVRWDAIDDPAQMASVRGYVEEARRRRVKVLMHISTNDLRERKAKLPSVAQYRSKVGRLIRTLRPLGVTEWGSWNEANHDTQPTFRSPKRAAQFFLEMRKMCRGCTIVGLDVLDQKGVTSYMQRFYRALGSRKSLVKLVGIHNYSEVNRRLTDRRSRSSKVRFPGTGAITRTAKRYNRRTKFWFTETGGLAEFGGSFPCDIQRQSDRTGFMFDLARKYRRDVTRLYIYNWTGTDCESRFDAGLITKSGETRAAYDVVRRELRRFKR